MYDLEVFAEWYRESVGVDKIECYKNCYETAYDIITNDVDAQDQIDKIFNIIDSDVPILAFEYIENHDNLFVDEVSKAVMGFSGDLPETYYATEGFERMLSVFKDSFLGVVVPRYKKFRNLWLTLPAIITTAIYSVLSFTGLFSFSQILKWNISEFLYIPAVFFIVELICVGIVLIKRSKTFDYRNVERLCKKYNFYEFMSEAYQICEDYAEKEKEIDGNELLLLDMRNENNYITDESGNEISEDDFLDSLING